MNGSRKLSDSYSVRKNAFLAWCRKNGRTVQEMERSMFLNEGELQRMLKKREKFNKTQITRLVYLMGARDAFFVIHFPSFGFRKRVYRQLFGREMPTREREHKRGEKH